MLAPDVYLQAGDCLNVNSYRRLCMQIDGNLVDYDGNHVLWASQTQWAGTGPFHLTMQPDCNLVLYDGSTRPHWSSNTPNKGTGCFAAFDTRGGSFCVYNHDGNALWWEGREVSENTTLNSKDVALASDPPYPAPHGDVLKSGQTLNTGDCIVTTGLWPGTGPCSDEPSAPCVPLTATCLQEDGNFVTYTMDDGHGHGHPTWASNTQYCGPGPYRVVMQNDCNLVLYDGKNNQHWASNTRGKGNNCYARNLGFLYVRNDAGDDVWESSGKSNSIMV